MRKGGRLLQCTIRRESYNGVGLGIQVTLNRGSDIAVPAGSTMLAGVHRWHLWRKLPCLLRLAPPYSGRKWLCAYGATLCQSVDTGRPGDEKIW